VAEVFNANSTRHGAFTKIGQRKMGLVSLTAEGWKAISVPEHVQEFLERDEEEVRPEEMEQSFMGNPLAMLENLGGLRA
jgi:hypothetical protein